MSLRHNLILLLAGAFALALIGPWLAPHRTAPLGSVVTAAPPLVLENSASGADDRALGPLRREAGGALGQLRARAAR